MSEIIETLKAEGWKSPNQYSCDVFEIPPKAPGVYMLVRVDFNEFFTSASYRPAYIGMSKNLRQRLDAHEVKALCDKEFYTQVWFKPLPETKIRSEEAALIRKYDPPYNAVHRNKGFSK